MKILITGACGYLGSELVRNLKEKNELILVDNLYQRTSKRINSSKNLKFVKKDIEKMNFNNYLKKVDYIIHLANISNTTLKKNDSSKIIKTNLKSLDEIISSCIKNDVKLLYISTSTVYGKQKKIVNENLKKSFYKPYNLYSKTKLLAERKINDFRSKKLKFSILRLGTLYGQSPNTRYDTGIQKFLEDARLGKYIFINKRYFDFKKSYLSLNDGVRAIKYVLKKNFFNGETYNVSGINQSIKQIIKYIKKEKPKIKLKFTNQNIINQTPCNISSNKFINSGFLFKDDIKKSIKKAMNFKTN